ncbi:TetR/AcrR family transcriptional regulator [Nocardia sp. NPDC051570]|uniref:TetR/AcrR family transcriptional regulator n=1 Tax=Nocardia sp. NPDC051570 TaxID=3364324 RepID=UPI0037B7FBCC
MADTYSDQDTNSAAGPALRADAARNLAKVLEAGRYVVARDGADAQMEDIAQHAGVGVATIYRRFGSKQGLLEALVADSTRNMDQRARPYADSADALQGLLDVLTMLLDLAARDRHLLIAQAGTPYPAASGITPDSELYATLQHLFTRAQQDGQIRPDITLDTIQPLITGMITATIHHPDDPTRHTALGVIDRGIRTD